MQNRCQRSVLANILTMVIKIKISSAQNHIKSYFEMWFKYSTPSLSAIHTFFSHCLILCTGLRLKNKGAANCTMIEWNLHVGFDPATINTGCDNQSALRAPHVGYADRSLIGARHNYRTPNVSQALRETKKTI